MGRFSIGAEPQAQATRFSIAPVEEKEPSFLQRLTGFVRKAQPIISTAQKIASGNIIGAAVKGAASSPAVRSFAVDVARSTPRSAAGVALEAFSQDPSQAEFTPKPGIEQTLFGKEQVNSFSRTADSWMKTVQEKAEQAGIENKKAQKALSVLGPLAAVAFTVGDIAPVSPSSSGGKILSQLSKLQKAEEIVPILRKLGMADEAIEETARTVARLSKPSDIQKVLRAAEETSELARVAQTSDEIFDEGRNLVQGIEDRPEIQTSVQKLVQALKEAKPIRKQQEKLYSLERGKRAEEVAKLRLEGKGRESLTKIRESLAGPLERAQFESLAGKIDDADIENLFNAVLQNPRLSDFEATRAAIGLEKMFSAAGGAVPTRSELDLLGKVFPEELTKELLKNRPTLTKLYESSMNIVNIPRTIQSSIDLSAPLRQGLFLVSKPKQFLPAFKDMFKFFASEDSFKALQASIESRPTYNMMREAGLALTEIGGDIAKREEAFASDLLGRGTDYLATKGKLGKLAGSPGQLVKASQRAYTGFLNKLRADTFDSIVQKAELGGYDLKENQKLVESVARFVNSATGRGHMVEALEKSAPALNAAFFSPRLIASRINLISPWYYSQLDPFVRKEALKTLMANMAIGGTLVGLAKAAGADVEIDPRSSDFLKIRPPFAKNTRIDIFGGFQQYMKFAAQVATNQTKSSTTGKVQNLGEGFRARSRRDVIIEFFENKEAPIPAFATKWAKGEDPTGKPFDATDELVNLFTPIMTQDLRELYEEYDLQGIPLIAPAFFGIGIQTYSSQPRKETPKGTGSRFSI